MNMTELRKTFMGSDHRIQVNECDGEWWVSNAFWLTRVNNPIFDPIRKKHPEWGTRAEVATWEGTQLVPNGAEPAAFGSFFSEIPATKVERTQTFDHDTIIEYGDHLKAALVESTEGKTFTSAFNLDYFDVLWGPLKDMRQLSALKPAYFLDADGAVESLIMPVRIAGVNQ